MLRTKIKTGETLVLEIEPGKTIAVVLVAVRGNSGIVDLGIEAPQEVKVRLPHTRGGRVVSEPDSR